MEDVLANIDLGAFKVLPWVFAVLIGGAWVYISLSSSKKKYWDVISVALQGLLAGVVSFFLLNFGVAAYIFNHLTDPRWSVGKEPLLKSNDLSSPVPGIKEILQALTDTQNQVVGAVNGVGRMQNALGVVGEFLLSAGKAMLVALFIALILLWVVKVWAPKRKANYDIAQRKIELAAEQERRRQEVADNKYRDERIAAIERHLGIDPPARN
jgi:hypothetical protein